MGTYALTGLALEPYEHYLGSLDVPCIIEQLLNKLATAFAYTHVAERAVTGV